MSDSSSESERESEEGRENGDDDEDVTFESLGLEEVLCDAAAKMGWKVRWFVSVDLKY